MFLSLSEAHKTLLGSSAIRQALILLLVFTVVTSAAWLASYWLALRDSQKLVEVRLEELIDATKIALNVNTPLPDVSPGQFLSIIHSDGSSQGSIPASILIDAFPPGVHYLESTENNGQTDYVALIDHFNDTRIRAVENVERLEEITDIFLVGLRFALLSSVVLTFVSGYYIARKNQTRLDQINRGLAEVSQGNLDKRIALSGASDDLKQLADRIDATTARLESTMNQMRVQTANIAHDLRTPLARLRALLEEHYLDILGANKPVSGEVLESALEQTDKLVEMFNAILRIAQIESGAQKASFVRLELADLLSQVVDTFGPVIEDQNQRLIVVSESPEPIVGDADLIILLLGNLIQNALRYGASKQTITLNVSGSLIQVIDEGLGIPAEEQQRVLQPLYQRERQQNGEGFGLGLALVKAICDLHDAELLLTNEMNQSGLRVSVHFPGTL